jgi:hypothetical protein
MNGACQISIFVSVAVVDQPGTSESLKRAHVLAATRGFSNEPLTRDELEQVDGD